MRGEWTISYKGALFIFLHILALRALFSLTTGLIDDEAYHWSWTKDLMLSYYDHPGFVAWMGKLSTALFGDSLLGVRAFSFLFYSASIVIAWRLARDLFGDWSAHFTAFMLLFTPLWGLGGYVYSPEPFFVFFWVSAAWVFWQGVRPDPDRWSPQKTWLWLGILMGLGLNSKFIMALLAPGFGLFLLTQRQYRCHLLSRWPWIGVLISILICLPIFLWNIDFDWPGFKYQFHDRHTDAAPSFNRWLQFLSAQVLFMTPVLFALMVAAVVRALKRWEQPHWRFIICLSAPSILIFWPQPYFADYKPHWSGPAYLFLVMGAGQIWASGVTIFFRQILRPLSRWLTVGLLIFLVPINLFFYTSFIYPWLPKAYRALNPGKEWNTTWDLTNEFHGWKEVGEFVNRRQREIHASEGVRPFIAALRYETTAQTWWGTGQRTLQVSRDRSHYSVLQKKKEALENVKGLNALVLTTEKYPENPMDRALFSSCEPEEFRYYRGDELSRIFTVWYCRDFQGVK